MVNVSTRLSFMHCVHGHDAKQNGWLHGIIVKRVHTEYLNRIKICSFFSHVQCTCMFTVYACIELHTIQIHTTKTKSTHSKPVMQWNNTNSKAYLTHISIYEFIFIFIFYFELNFLICTLKHMCYQARSYFKFIWIRRMVKLLSSFIHSFGIKRAYDVKDSCTSHRHRPSFAYFFDCLFWLKRQHVVWISLMHKTCNSSFSIKKIQENF